MNLFRSGSKEKGVLGVQFNANGLALASVSAAGANPSVNHWQFIPHSDSSIPSEAVRDCLDRWGLRGPQGRVVLSRDDYSLLLVEAPPVPERELRQALSWKVRDLIDFPVAEAVVDAFFATGR